MLKTSNRWLGRFVAILALAWVTGCGGGGGSGGGGTEGGSDSEPIAGPTGSVVGTVRTSADSVAIAGATVRAGSRSAVSAADGSFALDGVPVAERAVVHVEADGYLGTQVVAKVANGQSTTVAPRLVLASTATPFDPSVSRRLVVPDSATVVFLPANALVYEGTDTAPSGPVTARITPIESASDPLALPGGYTADDGRRVENFGALSVVLTDTAGKRLNLKAGATARIRIQAASRSGDLPAMLGLFRLDEATGLWVQEGYAVLRGAVQAQYYEGTVSHFSTWSVHRPQDTVFVQGCLNDLAGTRLAGVQVRTTGIDYSGVATVQTDAQGAFRIAARRGKAFRLEAAAGAGASGLSVSRLDSDFTMTGCIPLGDRARPPGVVFQPGSLQASDGQDAVFTAAAIGTQPMTYQWLRNGTPIPGATYEVLRLRDVRVADEGAQYSLRVRNAVGEATSSPATLSVLPPEPPVILRQPATVALAEGATAHFDVSIDGSQPMSFTWRRNGNVVAGADSSSLSFVADLTRNTDTYTVTVSNRAGTVTSEAAVLSVAPTPLQFEVQPRSTGALIGDRANFSAIAVGPPPISYQWQRNGVDIPGATTPEYTTPPVFEADNGAVYAVVARSGTQVVTSGVAILSALDGGSSPTPSSQIFEQLLSLAEMFAKPANIPLSLIDEQDRFASADTVCRSGTVAATLDGAPIVAGAQAPLSGVLASNASACELGFSDGESHFGSTSSVYAMRTSPSRPWFSTTTFTRAQVIQSGLVGIDVVPREHVISHGTVAITLDIAAPSQTDALTANLAPVTGATITNLMTGRTARFDGGSVSINSEQSQPGGVIWLTHRFNDLRITLGGVSYTVRGSRRVPFGGSSEPATGDIQLLVGTAEVGRVSYNAQGVAVYRFTDQIQSF